MATLKTYLSLLPIMEEEEELSGEEMAEELIGNMGTDSTGTTPDNAVEGINDYLDDHGENSDDWEVEHEEVDDYEDIGEMLREFEADNEDVIILLADTNARMSIVINDV